MWRERILQQAIKRLTERALPISVRFWNGETYLPVQPSTVGIAVHKPRALRALAQPSMGKLARAYVEGDFDLEGDARTILKLGEALCDADTAVDKKGSRALYWLRHSRPNARKNIGFHYDVSNDFFGLWLDSRRIYSCAYFGEPEDSLDRAQERKLDLICRKLMLRPGESLLDIGCGWGGLIFWAAERYAARCIGITLSQDQHDFVKAEVQRRGLGERVDVRLLDYREMSSDQRFDKIASVGMFEHVGRRNLNTYFHKIHDLLAPGGLVMNHGITSAGLDTEGLRSGISDFIEQYVFPGGELVHISRVIESLAHVGLECVDVESLRPHYAKTLWHWVERLEANGERARELIGEKKYRVWRIYMAGSAHAFARGWLSLFQVVAGKPLPDGTLPYPYTRAHLCG